MQYLDNMFYIFIYSSDFPAPITFLFLQARFYVYLPTTLFGIMAGISAFLVLTLPETNNMKLPDSLKEAQDLDRRKNTTEIAEDTQDIDKNVEHKTSL